MNKMTYKVVDRDGVLLPNQQNYLLDSKGELFEYGIMDRDLIRVDLDKVHIIYTLEGVSVSGSVTELKEKAKFEAEDCKKLFYDKKISRSDFSANIIFPWDDDEWRVEFLYWDNKKQKYFDWYYQFDECYLEELYFTHSDDDWKDDLYEDIQEYIIPDDYHESMENAYESSKHENWTDAMLELEQLDFREVTVEKD